MLADLGLCHFKSSDKDEQDVTDEDTYGTYAYGTSYSSLSINVGLRDP